MKIMQEEKVEIKDKERKRNLHAECCKSFFETTFYDRVVNRFGTHDSKPVDIWESHERMSRLVEVTMRRLYLTVYYYV